MQIPITGGWIKININYLSEVAKCWHIKEGAFRNMKIEEVLKSTLNQPQCATLVNK